MKPLLWDITLGALVAYWCYLLPGFSRDSVHDVPRWFDRDLLKTTVYIAFGIVLGIAVVLTFRMQLQ